MGSNDSALVHLVHRHDKVGLISLTNSKLNFKVFISLFSQQQ